MGYVIDQIHDYTYYMNIALNNFTVLSAIFTLLISFPKVQIWEYS